MPHTLTLQPPDNQFKGLAKNGLECGHCICELVDNSIAAKEVDFKVQIHLEANPDGNLLDVHIVDSSGGMTFQTLLEALPLGCSPGENQLNEHGFGMKNALSSLTNKNVLPWRLVTKHDEEISRVEGPFSAEMEIYSTAVGDVETLETKNWMLFPDEVSTVVSFTVTKKFFNTLKAKQGAHGQDPNTLKYYLIEELGMKYAGYLKGDDKGEISLTYVDFVHKVKPIERPIGGGSDYIECVIVDKDGNDHPLRMHYKWGDLDPTARDECVHNMKNGVLEKTKPKKYFLKTSQTQGFSVVLGKRTIITSKFDGVWPTGEIDEDGDPKFLTRHNNYNHYLGELTISDFPEGSLTTVNNKSGIDPDDENWDKVFVALGNHNGTKPVGASNDAWKESQYEAALVDKFTGVPGIAHVSRQDTVWVAGVRMDCIVKQNSGEITVYELKVKKATTLDLYQLRMYWDGLVDQGDTPTVGILAAHEFIPQMSQMVEKLNAMTDADGNRYNFETKTLDEPHPAGLGLGGPDA